MGISFIKKHPVLFYYILVFTVSWGGILLLIGGPGNIPGAYEQTAKLFTPALFIMFAGPFLSGILMNLFVGGLSGVRKLISRLLNWRAKPYWYVLAVFTGPVLVAAVLFGLSLFSKDYLPAIITTKDKIGSILFGVGWGLLGGGLLEETGWTGFAIPQLRKKYSILKTGLIVGILWGVWHYLIAFWSSNYMGAGIPWPIFVAGFMIFYVLALPAYRILLVWVYDRTKSLPVIMLMHAFLSASTIIFQPLVPGITSVVWNLVLSLVIWIIVGVIALSKRGFES